MRRLERVEGIISKMEFGIKRGTTVEEFENLIREMKDSLSDAKSFIQQEPLSPNEINPF